MGFSVLSLIDLLLLIEVGCVGTEGEKGQVHGSQWNVSPTAYQRGVPPAGARKGFTCTRPHDRATRRVLSTTTDDVEIVHAN
eukprot:CAMPEP_0174294694 /NCGR_PEP_ID=MMETSP0809-20121228/42374_1 /TAXON_ID=73025 ORGANISM="Eutreptiella gymnastica-like, Strain CCMP1594" /NCGR_SAMPLE_ID=MMETSP0809 /ASSEMBLY_ACC=CAM_ASM_000658 /LENGTH=81 /DNA_ID=CAMNT_0015396335 /DNA_START=202 /DNA_END=448 /DNA_ORIENTATION=+